MWGGCKNLVERCAALQAERTVVVYEGVVAVRGARHQRLQIPPGADGPHHRVHLAAGRGRETR